jgi:hypothetical protein
MAGLVPAIHVFDASKQDVDARHKAGHDGIKIQAVIAGTRPGMTSQNPTLCQ